MHNTNRNGFSLLATLIAALAFAACNNAPDQGSEKKWTEDTYNTTYRIFPNAPDDEILTYPWGSGTNNYFDKNAPVGYWNGKGHNHKYPDLFRFANGKKVNNIADWEQRRKEISAILQYYMHGRLPSIDPAVLNIAWSDSANTCTINLTHVTSGRTTTITLNHNPPAGAVEGARDKILLLGVSTSAWGAPTAPRNDWGTALFDISWGGSESNRSGTCATLYGLNTSADDTPSVNMQYAWAMSVILTVIEEGGLNGYYDPEKVGIYGFSRWGKAAMIIGAFAESRGGKQTGQIFIGSAGSGGPALDRWINQMGYKGHTEDPLPVNGEGAKNFGDLKGIEWYIKSNIADDHGATTAAQIVRGWTASTSGIPSNARQYGEASSFTRNPGPPNSWGRIQILAQARNETQGWFSARFKQLADLHNGLRLDKDSAEGILCSMPFDAHFITALIAPRIIYYEDGYNTMRNNPEGQWANWLICDEIYQMYAEELKDPAIIWRNAIKFYDIEHQHYNYQDQDEVDLTTAIYAGTQPNAKFRTPPFPADDPRYRWDFNRMDFGRPGHPTIAERVRKMRESPYKVKAVDTRGLLDSPERL
jgi:hypothetical protein